MVALAGRVRAQGQEFPPIFTNAAVYTLEGQAPLGVAAADIINNPTGGFPEVAVVIGEFDFTGHSGWLEGAGKVLIYRNTGVWSNPSSGFSATDIQQLTFPSGCAPSDVAFADVDNDGFQDLIVSAGEGHPAQVDDMGIYVFRNPGTGVYQTNLSDPLNQYIDLGPVRGLATGDFNNDGYPDLIVAQDYQTTSVGGNLAFVLQNDQFGAYFVAATVTLPPPNGTSGVGVADVVSGNFFREPAGQPVRLDAISSELDGGLGRLKNLGGFVFQESSIPAPAGCGWGFVEMVSAKFHTSSLSLDIAGTPYPGGGSVIVLHGTSQGNFSSACLTTDFYSTSCSTGGANPPILPGGMNIGSLNSGTKPDLAVTQFVCGKVALLLGKGDGTFQYDANNASVYHPSISAAGQNTQHPIRVVLTDLNQDGWDDIVTSNYKSSDGSNFGGTMSVLINTPYP